MTILLVFNTIVTGFIVDTTSLCQAIYQIINVMEDILCPFPCFLLHVETAFLYRTLYVQALHRGFL
jgi:hypothetical protein